MFVQPTDQFACCGVKLLEPPVPRLAAYRLPHGTADSAIMIRIRLARTTVVAVEFMGLVCAKISWL